MEFREHRLHGHNWQVTGVLIDGVATIHVALEKIDDGYDNLAWTKGISSRATYFGRPKVVASVRMCRRSSVCVGTPGDPFF
jgi:hypothetical protein